MREAISYFASIESGWQLIEVCLLLSIGGFLAFFLLLAELRVVQLSSGLTLSVAGIFKEVLTVACSAIFLGDHLTLWNVGGLGLCIIGIGMYNRTYGCSRAPRRSMSMWTQTTAIGTLTRLIASFPWMTACAAGGSVSGLDCLAGNQLNHERRREHSTVLPANLVTRNNGWVDLSAAQSALRLPGTSSTPCHRPTSHHLPTHRTPATFRFNRRFHGSSWRSHHREAGPGFASSRRSTVPATIVDLMATAAAPPPPRLRHASARPRTASAPHVRSAVRPPKALPSRLTRWAPPDQVQALLSRLAGMEETIATQQVAEQRLKDVNMQLMQKLRTFQRTNEANVAQAESELVRLHERLQAERAARTEAEVNAAAYSTRAADERSYETRAGRLLRRRALSRKYLLLPVPHATPAGHPTGATPAEERWAVCIIRELERGKVEVKAMRIQKRVERAQLILLAREFFAALHQWRAVGRMAQARISPWRYRA